MDADIYPRLIRLSFSVGRGTADGAAAPLEGNGPCRKGADQTFLLPKAAISRAAGERRGCLSDGPGAVQLIVLASNQRRFMGRAPVTSTVRIKRVPDLPGFCHALVPSTEMGIFVDPGQHRRTRGKGPVVSGNR